MATLTNLSDPTYYAKMLALKPLIF